MKCVRVISGMSILALLVVMLSSCSRSNIIATEPGSTASEEIEHNAAVPHGTSEAVKAGIDLDRTGKTHEPAENTGDNSDTAETSRLISETEGDFDMGSKRPRIENGTMVTREGNRLRGGAFWIYGSSDLMHKTVWALSQDAWELVVDYHFNVVRLACAYRPEKTDNYSLDEYENILDQLIDKAEEVGVYVIIDFHPQPGTYDMQVARDFWNRIAPRYKDREHVIYELCNEPKFSMPGDYTQQNIDDMKELWELCDMLAPETPLIIMTFNAVGRSGATPTEVVNRLEGIDWSKTAVGFHSYWVESSERMVELMSSYPVINTEFYTKIDGREMRIIDGYEHHGTLMEKLGISWIQWDIIDSRKSKTNLEAVISDLIEKDFYWSDSGNSS